MARGAYRPKTYVNVLHGGTQEDAPQGHGNRFERSLNNELTVARLMAKGFKVPDGFSLPKDKLYKFLDEATQEDIDEKEGIDAFIFSKGGLK